ncbi:MAG TPA: META domain-containing protein, partial [Desulfobulbus sp.]|nr:META domain-containing protein [Desulfobulbus sp.]
HVKGAKAPRSGLLLLIVLFLAIGCARTRQPVGGHGEAAAPACPLPTPATYVGTIPCADCAAIRLTLNLRPDSIYQLRKTWLDDHGQAKKTAAEMGRWRYVAKGNLIVLGRKKDMLNVLSIQGMDRLRILDARGKKIISRLPYELTRTEKPEPFPDTVRMKGMYRHTADGGIFTDCLSGVSFPVAAEGAARALEQAYLQTPHGQDEPLLVILEGSIEKRPGRNGMGRLDMVIPDRLVRVVPDTDCTGARTGTSLTRTTWRLVEVGGKPVPTIEGRPEPFFVLEPNGRQRGFSGCNRFFGTYLVRGDILVFNKMASTRMACRKAMDLEDAFLRAISATESYRVQGDILELRNREGTVLARLKAAGK